MAVTDVALWPIVSDYLLRSSMSFFCGLLFILLSNFVTIFWLCAIVFFLYGVLDMTEFVCMFIV